MGQQSVTAGHGPAQRRVESEPQPVAGERLVQRGVAGAERQTGRVLEDLAALEVLEPGAAHTEGCPRRHPVPGGHRRNPAASPRASTWSASSRLASSTISPSTSTAPRALALERGDDGVRPLELLRAWGEQLVQHRHLIGMHGPLAVEAERASVLGAQA